MRRHADARLARLTFIHSCRLRHRMKERRRNARVGLPDHGHREFRTLGNAVGPALHDAFVARVTENLTYAQNGMRIPRARMKLNGNIESSAYIFIAV